MSKEIPCAYCGVKKPWPDDFPDIGFAKCIECIQAEEELKKLRWGNQLLAIFRRIFT